MNSKLRFHLLPNAHLDPVWLWDWREGLTEGITTLRTVLDLMDEYPELTFLRGEAVIYRHIQRHAPAIFERILDRVKEGRWDVVGGTWVQPDANLSATETLCRHFEMSLEYFARELKVRPTVAWQADSFGHPAGWPNILAQFGMEGFAFTRPQRSEFPMESPAFWWRGASSSRLLCYRQHWMWYCSERDNVANILNSTLDSASKLPLQNVGILIGMGNHGGGPTRRHLDDIAAWRAAHPEVDVQFSTLHGFFDDLKKEAQQLGKSIPTVEGEFGFCLRGVYSSVQKFKSQHRRSESAIVSAELTEAVIPGKSGPANGLLKDAWEGVLFNSFHDILPGSSIERALDDQMALAGSACSNAQRVEFEAITRLATEVDSQVPKPVSADGATQVPVLIWNRLPIAYSGPMEIEVSLDYRPLFGYHKRPEAVPFALFDHRGRELPFQEIATEHTSMPDLPWRKRVVTHLTIPAFGWKIVRLGLTKEKTAAKKLRQSCIAGTKAKPFIANPQWRIDLSNKNKLNIRHQGSGFLSGKNRMRLMVVEDPWGSWGGMDEKPESYCLDRIQEEWSISETQILENGPERSRLWTRWEGQRSWVELTFDLCREQEWIKVHGRLLWNQRSSRLQLVLPSTGAVTCDVPGGTVDRSQRGQVPVGRWFYRTTSEGSLSRMGVATDVLGDADFLPHETRLTLARASRYANDVCTDAKEQPWLPAVDCGELKFQLGLFAGGISPDQIANALLFPPVTLPITPHRGQLAGEGSFGRVSPASVRVLSVQKKSEGTIQVRAQNRSHKTVKASFWLNGERHTLGQISPQEIVTVQIQS